MEYIDSLHLLASSHKLDWFCDNSTNRQCSSTSGVTIKFCEHHSVEIQSVVKLLSCIDCILTSHRVNNEKGFIRIEGILQGGYLVHHLLVNRQSSGSIHDNHIVALCLCLLDSIIGNLHNILVVGLGIYGHSNSLAHNLQLLNGSRTIDVASHQQWFFVVFALKHIGKLSAEGSLTRTLKS